MPDTSPEASLPGWSTTVEEWEAGARAVGSQTQPANLSSGLVEEERNGRHIPHLVYNRGPTVSRGRGYEQPPDWKQTVVRILDRDGRICYLCAGHATTVDHVIPQARGGGHEDDNLAAICTVCHDLKSERERLEGIRLAASRRSARGRSKRSRPREPHPNAPRG